jgi:hypothetical protein
VRAATGLGRDPDPEARFRDALAELSDNPHLKAWSAERNLLHRLTAAVNLVADGDSPRPVLAFLAPRHEFEVTQRGSDLVQSEQSTQRYDLLSRSFTSLSPQAVGRFYGAIRALCQTALAQIARPATSFDAVAHSALRRLLETPIPAGEPALTPKSAGYAFVEPTLEALSPPQKNLLRMGVSNARSVQAWLGAVEKALPPNPS